MPYSPVALFAFGALLAALVAGAAWRMGALTRNGALSAALVGAFVFGATNGRGAAPLLVFFLTSTLLSRWRKRVKDALGFAKGGQRDAGQVWANGGVAVFCACLPWLVPLVSAAHAFLLVLAALSAANADTWATEIGAAWGGSPFLLTTGKRVPPGTSGAVSVAGLLAALAGASLIGAFAGRAFWVVTLAGWSGALADSLLGAAAQAQWQDELGRWTEQSPFPGARPARGWSWMDNDVVNGFCTLLAALLCAFVLGK